MNLYYWPPDVPRVATLEAFIRAYQTLGYTECSDGQEGFEKIALYAKQVSWGIEPTHAARQLLDGKWTSKLGVEEDVAHTKCSDVEGPCYGTTIRFMKRPRPSGTDTSAPNNA
jgi:hypothetical protein